MILRTNFDFLPAYIALYTSCYFLQLFLFLFLVYCPYISPPLISPLLPTSNFLTTSFPLSFPQPSLTLLLLRFIPDMVAASPGLQALLYPTYLRQQILVWQLTAPEYSPTAIYLPLLTHPGWQGAAWTMSTCCSVRVCRKMSGLKTNS